MSPGLQLRIAPVSASSLCRSVKISNAVTENKNRQRNRKWIRMKEAHIRKYVVLRLEREFVARQHEADGRQIGEFRTAEERNNVSKSK